jgi:hypothetical protein
MKRLALAAAIAVSATTLASSVQAQLWLRDRAATQGPGIRTGDVEIHPGVAAEIGYDSNFFNRSDQLGPRYPVVGTTLLRITPQLHITNLRGQRAEGGGAPPKVAFQLGGAFIHQEFLTNTDLLGRSRQYGALADALVQFLPGQPVGFNVYDNFVRTAQPSLDPDVTVGLNRIENRAGGELVLTKRGGLFDWRFGYAFGLTHFESGPAQDLNNTRHELYTRGRFRFLPRTALIYDGSVWFFRFNRQLPGLSDSTPVRARIGLSGLLTYRFALLAMVGWGASFYQNAKGAPEGATRDSDSIIGQLEARYYLAGNVEAGEVNASLPSVFAGLTRDFQNSYIGNFYERTRGYVGIQQLFGGVFYTSVTGGLAAIRYADVLDRRTGVLLVNSFTNTRIDASVFLEYRVTNWLGINGTFQYLAENSDVRIPLTSTDPSLGTFVIGFNRFQAYGGVRVFY